MAETLISPGVLARENDQSFISQNPITVGAAILGPTVKGPVEIPTLVTSYSDYQQKFGTTFTSASQVYTYFTSIAAFNYFNNGGETLLVTRVVSGTFSPATTNSGSVVNCFIPTTGSATSQSFTLETLSEGTIMNSSSSLDVSGSLANGSINNIRWQTLNSTISQGTFDLLIRRGDDTTQNPIILETWTNLSLDPFAPNYIAAVLGDYNLNYNQSLTDAQIQVSGSYPNRSAYVRVANVNAPTPNYFLNSGLPNPAFTGSLPINTSGSFGNASGDLFSDGKAYFYNDIVTGTSANEIQGIPSASYNGAIALMANQDDYRFNVLLAPGLFNTKQTSQITTAINNTQNRGDSLFVVDPIPYGMTVGDATSQAQSRNTSYAAMYWPWIQTMDPDSGKNVWVPASTMIGGVYAYNDTVAEPWFAPAGINRGGLSTVIRAEQKLSQTQRDTLYTGKINPIATFPGQGVVVYGQKTLQTKASALDRVNVRRLLIALKSYISQVAQNLVFEQNTIATRNQFLSQVNPYLESVQQRQGLYAFKVIMDSSNNTPDVIDRNQLIGQIYIQPTKTAEFIYLDFNILPTGATFPA
jgi:phage tail sheath protein FI